MSARLSEENEPTRGDDEDLLAILEWITSGQSLIDIAFTLDMDIVELIEVVHAHRHHLQSVPN